MSKFSFLTAALVLSAGTLIWAGAEKDAVRVPVLLELFTSEGCSSCPPADRLLENLDNKQPVPGGRSDRAERAMSTTGTAPAGGTGFLLARFTARQQEYTNKFHLNGVYTPQLVVDGQIGLVGSDALGGPRVRFAKQFGSRRFRSRSQMPTRDGNQVTRAHRLAWSRSGWKRRTRYFIRCGRR